MKPFLLFFALCIPVLVSSQNEVEKIKSAISEGNSSILSSFFSEEIDLVVLDDEDLYSKPEATAIVEKFFLNAQSGTFELKHEGVSKLNHQYYIGDFSSTTGDEYRITFFMKSEENKLKIKQLRIEDF